jgi:hypothetical protein
MRPGPKYSVSLNGASIAALEQLERDCSQCCVAYRVIPKRQPGVFVVFAYVSFVQKDPGKASEKL